MSTKKILIRAVFWIMAATLGSRILGFLREVQLAYYFGLSPMRGAYTVAFKIPNLLRLLVADAAISAAFIPVLTGYLVQKNKEEAFKIASQIFNITFLILSAIVILCEIFMPAVIRITTPGFAKDPFLFQQTVALSRIIFPIIILLGVGGVIVGVLHTMNIFGAPAIAPIFWNIANLAAVFALHQQFGIYAAAWGLLAATFIQFLVQGAPCYRIHWRYTFQLGLSHPAVKQVGQLIIPVMLSIGVINFNILVDNFFASWIGPSEVAAMDSAFRLFHLPLGLFAIAIGTVLFPVLSGLVVKNEIAQFSRALQAGLRQIFFITLPFTGWFILLALPIVRLCFERGSFSASDSKLVAWALIFYAIGMSFASANTLLNRGFYSLQKTWVPLSVAIINIILNAALDWWLMKPLGLGGICLSTSIVSIFNFFALCYLMKKQAAPFQLKPLLTAILRMTVVTAIVAGSSYEIWKSLEALLGTGLFSQLLSLGGGLAAGAATYLALAYLLKFIEIKEGLILFKKEKKVL